MAVIVSVTAVLVTEPPAKASVKPPKYITDTVPIGNLEVNYTIEPAKAGPNVIHLYFFSGAGVPANVDDAKLSATLPSQGLGPIRIPLQRIVPSHYTTPAGCLPAAGRVAGHDRSEPRRVRGTDPNRHRPNQRGLR